MKVLMTGSSGFLGSALRRALEAGGHTVAPLVRRGPRPGSHEIEWDPRRGQIEAQELEGADAAIHLAGVNIGGTRWTAQHKARVLDSRVRGTRLFSETLARLDGPPKVLLSASGVGFYGDRGDEVLTEASDPGSDFVASVCRAWEGQTEPARSAGIRVINARTAPVLDPSGGILPWMLIPFRFGVGGRLGPGSQWFSWITLTDYVGAALFVMEREDVEGPVNVAAPNPVTNAVLTAAVARVLHRPAFLAAPAILLKVALGGEMADALLLVSQRVHPAVLERAGYRFAHSRVDDALRSMIGGHK